MLPTIAYRTPVTRDALDFDLEGLFNGFFGDRANGFGRGAADLYETEDGYALELEVPGFREEDVEVTVDRGVLTVSASRDTESTDEGRTYHVRERRAQRFARSFALPASVNAEEVKADIEAGVLTVRLPKAPEAKPRRIAVKAR